MGVCDVPGASQICQGAGAAADSAITASARWFATALGDTAAWLLAGMWSALADSTRVELTSPAYVGVYRLLLPIAVCLMLILFFAQLIGGLWRRDPSALTTATVGLGKAVIGSFLVLGVTATLLEITDQLAAGIITAAGTSVEQMGVRLATLVTALGGLSGLSPTAGVLLAVGGSGLLVVGAVLVWSSLLIRKAVLLVLIVLAPVALSGWVWSATRDWVRRWAAVVAALIVSKLVIVIVLLVATAQLSTPVSADLAPVGDVLSGIVLLFLAAFAPYMAYRFISFAGIDAPAAVAAEQDSKRAALPHPAHAPTTLMGLLRHRGGPAPVLSGTGSGTGINTPASVLGGPAATTAGVGAAAAGGVAAVGRDVTTSAATQSTATTAGPAGSGRGGSAASPPARADGGGMGAGAVAPPVLGDGHWSGPRAGGAG
jgi:type IV secretion system protein TrbL